MADYVKVAKTSEVVPGQGKLVETAGQSISLFSVDGAIYAIDDACSHRGGPVSRGVLDGRQVICPWHRAKFDVATGAVI